MTEKNLENWSEGNLIGGYVSIFNNELIGCIGIYSIVKHLKIVSCAKAMLILPLVCHDELVSYVGRANTDVKSIEQLVLRKADLIANFNARFYSLLSVSVNSLLILNSLTFVKTGDDGTIYLVEGKDFIPSKDKRVIGKRAYNIIKSSEAIAKLLDDNTENLYLQLRVKL